MIKIDDILIDGKSSEDVGDLVLKDRELLSSNGLVLISATLSKKDKKIIVDPEIMTRGFIYERDNMEIINDVKEISLNVILENLLSKNFIGIFKINANAAPTTNGLIMSKNLPTNPVTI